MSLTPFHDTVLAPQMIEDIKAFQEQNSALGQESIRYVTWIVGFSAGSIAILLNSLEQVVGLVGVLGVQLTLFLLCCSLVIGIVIRAQSLSLEALNAAHVHWLYTELRHRFSQTAKVPPRDIQHWGDDELPLKLQEYFGLSGPGIGAMQTGDESLREIYGRLEETWREMNQEYLEEVGRLASAFGGEYFSKGEFTAKWDAKKGKFEEALKAAAEKGVKSQRKTHIIGGLQTACAVLFVAAVITIVVGAVVSSDGGFGSSQPSSPSSCEIAEHVPQAKEYQGDSELPPEE